MSRSFHFTGFCRIEVSLHCKLPIKSIFNSEFASHSFGTTKINAVPESSYELKYSLTRQAMNLLFSLVNISEKLFFHVTLIDSYPFIISCVELDGDLNLNLNRKA